MKVKTQLNLLATLWLWC